MKRFTCWLFGHKPEYAPYGVVPCERCGCEDIPYEELCQNSRIRRLWHWLRHWSFRKWWPAKCNYCGGRFKCNDNCVPF